MAGPSRRALLALLLAPAGPALGRPAEHGPRMARLLPGGAPLAIHRVVEDDSERLVRLRVSGPGMPASEVVVPTRYGGTIPLRVLPLAGREVLLATIDGNGGTGIAQRLGALIGVDAAGRLRVIGIENLETLQSATCESRASLRGTLAAAPGALRLRVRFQRVPGDCGPRPRPLPHREAWEESLRWDGQGPLSAPPPPPGAGPVRRATAAARAHVLRLLAPPVTDLRGLRLDETGLYDLAG